MSTLDLHPWRLEPAAAETALAVLWNNQRVALMPLAGAYPYGGRDDIASARNLQCTVSGSWLRCERQCRVADGDILVRDVLRWSGPGLLEWHRSWQHEQAAVVPRLEFCARVEPCGKLHGHLLPGILYDGNPGAVPERLVPRLTKGAENLFEEHKFPTPLVHVETEVNLTRIALTLQSDPCAVVDGHVFDQWWSLGLAITADGGQTTLLSVSGRLALNGANETIYDCQNHTSPYRDTWVDARPRHVYEKHYRIHITAEAAPHTSWRGPMLRCLAEQPSPPATNSAALEEALELKTRYALRRWFQDENACGMLWYPNRPEYAGAEQSVEYGWVGQNMRLGLSLWRWGKRSGSADLMEKGRRVADCWLAAALPAMTQGKPVPTRYMIPQKRWCDVMGGQRGFPRPTMETLYELAMFCRRMRQAGEAHKNWEEALHELLAFHLAPQRRNSDGLFPLVWSADGQPEPGPGVTAGALIVAALSEASQLPGAGKNLLPAAQELMAAYAHAFLERTGVHPCGSALDSGCEDMESGMFLLIAAASLFQAETAAGIANAKTLAWAAHAADWVLTWAYTWDVPLLPGTLLQSAGFRSSGWSDVSVQNRCLHAFSGAAEVGRLGALLGGAAGPGGEGEFRTSGMSDVSVQNRHLHVFSPAAEIARLGGLMHDPGAFGGLYREQAQRMLAPLVRTIARPEFRYGMDEDGEQTEQYNQTNYIQHPGDPVCRPRGGIARWFVPWMTSWVMSVCLDFLETPPTRPA